MSSLLDVFRSNAGKFSAKLAEVRSDLDDAERKLKILHLLPAPLEESVATIMGALDRRAAMYEENLLQRIAHVTENPLASSDDPGVAASMILGNSQAAASGQELECLLAYFCRDEIEAGFTKMLKRKNVKAGPPRAQREPQIAQLQGEIQTLKRIEKEMLAELDTIKTEAAGASHGTSRT